MFLRHSTHTTHIFLLEAEGMDAISDVQGWNPGVELCLEEAVGRDGKLSIKKGTRALQIHNGVAMVHLNKGTVPSWVWRRL